MISIAQEIFKKTLLWVYSYDKQSFIKIFGYLILFCTFVTLYACLRMFLCVHLLYQNETIITTKKRNTKNMKVKVISDRKIIEKELDLEYPYHLYFQDEYCLNDELHRVSEKDTIIVKNGIHYNTIERVITRMQDEYIIQNNLTTEEHFFECYDNVNMNIHNAIQRIYNKKN